MTLIKSLLLGSAAGFIAVATAQAADLPTKKAAPADEFLKVCKVGGVTGYMLPGTTDCVKIYGGIQFEIAAGGLNTQYTGAGVGAGAPTQVIGVPTSQRDALNMGGRMYIGFTETQNSSLGLVKADARINIGTQFGSAHPLTGIDSGGGVGLDHAYIDIGGFEFGLANGSLYDLGNGNGGEFDYISPDSGANSYIRYTADFGNGFTAAVELDDPAAKRSNGTWGGSPANVYHGTDYPDATIALKVAQPWGSAGLAFAIHDVNIVQGGGAGPAAAPFDTYHKLGYGVNGQITVNAGPMIAVQVQGAYSYGAPRLGGFDGNSAPVNQFMGNGADFMVTDAFDNGGKLGWSTPTDWSVAGNVVFKVNPQFKIGPQISYGSISYSGSPTLIPKTVTGFWGGIIANWDPTPSLDFQLDLIYEQTHASKPTAFVATAPLTSWQSNSSGFWGRLAITKSF